MRICKICKKEKPLEAFKKNKNSKNGYENCCKDCFNEKERKRYTKRKSPIQNGTITCRRCKTTKNITEFNTDKKVIDGRRKICKTCDNKRIQIRRELNKQELSESYWNRRAESANYRVNKNKKAGINGTQLKNIYDELNKKCYYCGNQLTEMHIEHKTPLSKNGTHSIDNITISCPTCNRMKNTMTEDEFITMIKTISNNFANQR